MSVTKMKKKSRLLDRALPVAEVPIYSTALFYGESGTGKTTVAATYPKPLLLLDLCESGTETIKKVEDVDVLTIESWKEFEESYWELEQDKQYKTIVYDQVSALQALGIAHVRTAGKMEADDIFSKRDWGKLSGMMQTWLLNHRNLSTRGKNIVFLAHQRTFGGEDDESEDQQMAPRFGARLSPSVESFLNGAVSVIGNTFIRERWIQLDPKKPKKTREVTYCMRIGPHGSFRTKIRKPPESELPDVIVNPTYEKIMRLSSGEGSVKKVVKKVRK